MLDTTYIFDGTLGVSLNPPTGVAITTTRVSTNVLDLLVARDLGAGAILGLNVKVTQAFASGTSLEIALQVSADNTTFYDILESPVYPVAQLILGAPIFRYALPLNQLLNGAAGVLNAPGRYLRLNYTVVGTFTTGAVFSFLNPINDRDQTYIYPNNYVAV